MDLHSALLISPYFPPSNLAGVQRTRLISSGLKKWGWTPIVVTVDPESYEEPLDFTSLQLLPLDLRIERVRALPTWLCRPMGIGDISLRAQWALRRRVAKLIQAERPSIIFATVLPGYTSLVGSWAKRRFNIPFVLDYQDPWVTSPASSKRDWSKADVARRLATWLEPKMLRNVDALTAVSEETLDSLHARNLIKPKVPIEIIPIGANREDHAVAKQYGHSLIERNDGKFHIAYLGTLTQRMLPALKTFLRAVRALGDSQLERIRIHLIGTSAQPTGHDQHNLATELEGLGLIGRVHLHPARVGYLDALRTMQDADLLLTVGSSDSHYTASKLFPYWLSGKPIFALFHARSTVNDLARELGGVRVVSYDDNEGAETRVNETLHSLRELTEGRVASVPPRNDDAFELYSGHGVARRYAALFDQVLAKRN